MKKKFIYLLAVICSLSLCTACSDDDDNDSVISTEKTFTTEDGLLLAVDGQPLLGKVATFTPATSGSKATITLSGEPLDLNALIGDGQSKATANANLIQTCGVIPGSPVVTIPLDIVDRAFSGSHETEYCTFNYAGSISNDALQLTITNVELKNKTLSGSSWDLAQIELDDWGDYVSGVAYPTHIVWESTSGIELFPGSGYAMPTSDLVQLLTLMPILPIEALDTTLTVNEAISAVLKQIDFNADGNIRANYVDLANGGFTPVQSPANLAQYVVKDANTILVFLNIQNIIYTAMQNSRAAGEELDLTQAIQVLSTYMPYIQNGIPLQYADNGGYMTVYLNTQFLMPIVTLGANLLKNEGIMNMIVGSMGDMDEASKAMISGILAQIPAAIEGTTKIELGINLVKKN